MKDYSIEQLARMGSRVLEWSAMSDSQMRLLAGEMSGQEIRAVHAILNNVISHGESAIKLPGV